MASNDLAARIRDGAKAGVFLSASAKSLEELRAKGLVEPPAVFASNRLVIIVPAKNTAEVTHIVDLTRKGVKLVLGAKGVAVGDYARESLELAGLAARSTMSSASSRTSMASSARSRAARPMRRSSMKPMPRRPAPMSSPSRSPTTSSRRSATTPRLSRPARRWPSSISTSCWGRKARPRFVRPAFSPLRRSCNI